MSLDQYSKQQSRRGLIKYLGLLTGAAALPAVFNTFGAQQSSVQPNVLEPELPLSAASPLVTANLNPHRVAIIKTTDRATGVRQAIELLQPPSFSNKRVFIKPNYNTGDPAPAATAPIVLETVVQELQAAGASIITVGDRSGMAETRQAMTQMQVFALAQRYGFNTLVFDELGQDDWQYFSGAHWSRGFAMPRPLLDSDAIINVCCLKTHRFGGHFTLSLKNTIGMVARYVPGDPHDYMRELHRSASQRLMIAEVNSAYRPSLVVIDGVDAFVGGGPEQGQRVQAGVVLASTDRIAIDAVGIAILRKLGTTRAVASGSIWSQAQIRRAADLGLGAVSADQIELVTTDQASAQMADEIRRFLT